jgi:hypothetical protein
MMRLQQGFATSEMGINVLLRSKNPEPPMPLWVKSEHWITAR